MKRLSLALALALAAHAIPGFTQVGAGPAATPRPAPRPAPRDRIFPGEIRLAVDAADTDHKIMRVREHVPLESAAPLTLLYPQWESASHAPTSEANALAGLVITSGGRPVRWRRVSTDPFAFQVTPPLGAKSLDIDFQYISPTTTGRLAMTPDLVAVAWNKVLLYPAGWYARDIPVGASLRLPEGLTPATSLESEGRASGVVDYRPVSLETLVDSPVYAGRHARSQELGRLGGAPVRAVLLAEAPEALAVSDPQVNKLRALVREVGAVFGAPPFGNYTFLMSLSDNLPSTGGTEHLRSSEINLAPNFFARPGESLMYQDLMPHELVHSWNGKAVTPEGLWTPDLNSPFADDLLWIYEGQTEYWGLVLAARAGLRTRQETLDLLAVRAGEAKRRTGRSWKSLADSSLDPVFDAGHAVTWPDWQGREAYYVEGIFLWLDVDTLIRERTGGRRSLDDFARSFFAAKAREVTRTYTLTDICQALVRVAPGDWASFFEQRLHSHEEGHLFDGVRRGGYTLDESAQPTETARQAQIDEGGLDLRSSLGLLVGKGGRVRRVAWESPAFRAGIGLGATLTEVNGEIYSDAALVSTLRSPPGTLRLTGVQDGRKRNFTITGASVARYPVLRPVSATRSLDTILSPQT